MIRYWAVFTAYLACSLSQEIEKRALTSLGLRIPLRLLLSGKSLKRKAGLY